MRKKLEKKIDKAKSEKRHEQKIVNTKIHCEKKHLGNGLLCLWYKSKTYFFQCNFLFVPQIVSILEIENGRFMVND